MIKNLPFAFIYQNNVGHTGNVTKTKYIKHKQKYIKHAPVICECIVSLCIGTGFKHGGNDIFGKMKKKVVNDQKC